MSEALTSSGTWVSHKARRNGELIYRALVREVMVQQLLAMERTG
jgi:hypothetical protein